MLILGRGYNSLAPDPRDGQYITVPYLERMWNNDPTISLLSVFDECIELAVVQVARRKRAE